MRRIQIERSHCVLREDGCDGRREWVAVRRHYRDAETSPKWFESEDCAEGSAERWMDTGVLVELEVG